MIIVEQSVMYTNPSLANILPKLPTPENIQYTNANVKKEPTRKKYVQVNNEKSIPPIFHEKK
jgi:hypothetical protein